MQNNSVKFYEDITVNVGRILLSQLVLQYDLQEKYVFSLFAIVFCRVHNRFIPAVET